jgi:hypothetical protein
MSVRCEIHIKSADEQARKKERIFGDIRDIAREIALQYWSLMQLNINFSRSLRIMLQETLRNVNTS